MRRMACLAMLATTMAGCGNPSGAAQNPELVSLAKSGPFGQLAAALVEGDATEVRALGKDKFAYIRKEKGSMSTDVGKLDIARFVQKIGKCRSLDVREIGQKTKQGYDVPGGDLMIACEEIVPNCGPSMFAFFTNGPLGEATVMVESQHADHNRCAPAMSEFADKGTTVG